MSTLRTFTWQHEIAEYPARLFLCSNADGTFEVEEMFNFTQQDMEDDDVMILDTHDNIFVWIGYKANPIEKKEAMKTALVWKYLFILSSFYWPYRIWLWLKELVFISKI